MKIRMPWYWYVIAVPLLITYLGAASNQLVFWANWGKFPVMLNDRAVEKMKIADVQGCSQTQFALTKRQEKLPMFQLPQAAPVIVEACELRQDDQFIDDVHSIMGKNSNIKFLADWINLHNMIASPGDLLLMLGDFLTPFAVPAWLALVIRKSLVKEEVGNE